MPETKDAPKSAGIKTHDHDRVTVASRKADGTPDQTEDFTFIGDKQASIDASKAQLGAQAVSGVDVEIRGAGGADGTDQGSDPDPEVQKIIDAHEKAQKAGEATAEAEVNARFEDVNG